MPAMIQWPSNLKITDRSDPHLSFNTRSGGASLAGIEQVVSPLSSVWRWRATVLLRDVGSVRSFRTVKTQLQGRFNYLRMRVCDRYRLSRREVGLPVPGEQVPHSDDSLFSDDSGYAPAEPSTVATADAAVGATLLTVRAADFAGAITAGVFFSVADWLYQIEGWVLSGDDAILTISPPLRVSVRAGDIVDMDAKAVWTLTDDDIGDFDLSMGRFGAAQISLIEAIGRAVA